MWVAGGATCHRNAALNELGRPPIVLDETPPLEEILVAINRSDRVTKMQSPSATVELVDGGFSVPRLSATLAVDRPNRIRVLAKMPVVMSEGLDVGSNDSTFWMRYPEGMQKTLLYARHDEFERVMIGSPLPINPKWLIEALGLIHLEAEQVIEGPRRREDGNYELRLATQTQSGTYHRVLDIDAKGGFVRNQAVFGPDGRLVAQALGDDFRYYEDPGVVLPHSIFLYIQPVAAPAMRLRIEVGKYVLNQLLGADPRLFEMPVDGNHQVVDLSRLAPTPLAAPSPQLEPSSRLPNAPSDVLPQTAGSQGSGSLVPGVQTPAPQGQTVASPIPGSGFGGPGIGGVPEMPPRGSIGGQIPVAPEGPSSTPYGTTMRAEGDAGPGIPLPRAELSLPEIPSLLEATPWSPEDIGVPSAGEAGTGVPGTSSFPNDAQPLGPLLPIRDYVKVGDYGPRLRGTQLR